MRACFPPLLLVLMAMGSLCPAAPPPAENSTGSGELRFRRVYFPEGMKEWPKGSVKYLPMEADEFDRLLETIQRTAPGGPSQSSAGLVAAQYDARFMGPSLLQGSATLDVSQSIASAMLMTLDPCNLAIDRAQWVTSDGAPAVLGITGDGKLQVLAERSGRMKLDWSLAGQRDTAGGVNFTIALPPSPVNRLRIELPTGLAPAVDHGIVADEGLLNTGSHRWSLELGGRAGCRLRLAKAGSEEVRPQVVLARQSATYDFSLRGAELSVKLNIEAHREPWRKVVVGLDPALELVEVSTGDVSLPWSVVTKPGDKVRRVAIALPPSLQEGAASLRLRAIAPLSMPGSWTLPRMVFDGVVCRSNTIRLSIPSPLSIEHLGTRGCRQTGVAALTASAGQQLDFEAFTTDAGVDLSLSQRPTEVRAVSATATLLGQGKMSSRVATDFHTGQGPVFSLEAVVSPNWTINSVESQPTDGLDDWTVESRGGTRKLSIRLARPLTSRPLRLIVSAGRLYAFPGRNLGIDDLVPLRFVSLSESSRWVDLCASGSNELHFTSGDHLRRAGAKDLTAAELDLFLEPPGDLLFRDDIGAVGLRLSLEKRRPTYSAAIRVEGIVSDAALAENYSFTCTPSKAAPIDRVVVHLAGHRDGPLSWSVAGMDESRFSARRWPAQQETSAGLTANEENWDITFHNPRSVPVEIRASRQTKLSGPTPLCLASLPDAARQEATLIVRSLGPRTVQIKTHRMKPLPMEAAAAGQVQTARASFQYDPRTEAAPQSEPAVVLTAAGRQSATAWVWDCEIRSQVASNGAGDHIVSYRLQNAGSQQIRLTLPVGLLCSDIHGIWVNDKPAAVFSGTDPAAGELAVDLPADLKFVTLVLRISTHGAPLGSFCRLQPPLPDIGLPVFARHWRLELPPGYTTLSCDHAQSAFFSFRRCLLGCLGRDEDKAVFNPLRREHWQSLLPWRKMEDRPADATLDAETARWTQFPIDLADGASTVLVVRRAAIDAGSWLLFLAIVGIGTWGLSGRPLALLMLVVILGLPALLLPPAISVVFSRGLLGVMFCLLVGLVRRRMAAAGESASNRRVEMPSTLTNVFPFGAPLLAAVMLSGLSSANAGETAKSPPVTHSVFIPVDEKQQPTNGKYFLPEPFFAELYRRAALQAEKPQGWMIVSAVYRAELADDAAQVGHVVDRLAAGFDIRVFNATARVRIPLRCEEASLEPGQAKLNDRSVQPEWEPDGSALLLEIPEPGEYHLELTLRPTVQPCNRASGFDLSIPRVSTSRLEFTVPTGGPQVEFPTALGAVRWEEVQSRWIVDLGPSQRLAVRWQDAVPAGAGADVDVEQFLWLKIEPGCVLLDVRMKVKATSGPLRRLLVRADSALELLPSTGPASPTVQILGGGDSAQTYEIQWPQPVDSAATFDLHFLWNGTASLGTFHVPRIDVVDARPVRRSLAVSIDPALEYHMPGARLQEAGALPEFINNWGTAAAPPELAFRLNGNAAEWSLITRARRVETSGDQNVSWSFDAQAAEVQLDAQLITTASHVFQYRLEAPPTLHVDSIAVLVAGANQATRWSREQDGHITVFLASPVTGHHELQLRGQMPLTRKRNLALPHVRLEDVRIQNTLISLFRRPDVLVEVSGVGGLADVKTTADEDVHDDQGRPVRSFYADPFATSAVLVTIKPNRPRVRAEQVTRITCVENQWRTTCEYSLQVSEGLLDAIDLDVPASWKETVKISPAMASAIATNSDERASLVLSPSSAISRDDTFTLTGPPSTAGQFAVPNLAMKHVESVKKYVVLPYLADQRPVDWSLQNLRRCDPKVTAPDDPVKYEVVAEPWQAVLLPSQKATATARVVQADVRYAWQVDGRCLGAAFLDVETAGAIDCRLELPDGFDLLQFSVDGLPVDAVRGAAGTWAVPLVSQAPVSRVELLYFAESAIARAPVGWTQRCSFRAPKLGELPVERIAWTVASPRTLQPTIADDQNQMPPVSADNAKAGDIAAQWQRFIEDGQTTVSFATGGAVDAITLDYQSMETRSWLPRLGGVAGLLAVVGLAALLIRRGLLREWFTRWPYVFGVGVGLAWWLWLSPSAVGLMIVLAVLLHRFLPWRRFPRAAAARGLA